MNWDKIFDSFNGLNILIIGDVMVDSYLWGKVERISPEAPVPVVSVNKKETRPGGAANVALNVQALGANAILCSYIGNDEQGEVFLDLLEKLNLSSSGIMKSADRVTTLKTRILSSNHQMLRVDEETDKELSTDETEKLYGRICGIITGLKRVDAIIFEDYDKGVITPLLINKVVEMAHKKNIPTVVDPKKRNFNAYHHVTLFKPNLKELKEGLKTTLDLHDKKQLDKVVAEMEETTGNKISMVTLSEHGIYISAKGVKTIIPAHIRSIADVSGAGDTVISVAAVALALNLGPYYIAALSNLAGGLVCETAGVVPINKERLLEEAMRLIIDY